MTFEWSPQQDAAIKAAQTWIQQERSQVFRLFGFAGTGKTTLAKEIASAVKGEVLYGAFTGKAAQVMRRKGCRHASTIHSMIYKLDDEEEMNGSPSFVLNQESDVAEAELVIIDECSMVDEQIGKDLLSFGTKVLVLGDPAQLPPIKGAGFFTEQEPDVMMTEVHRQARENPIIRLSMQIREGGKLDYGQYGESRVITREELDQGDVMSADQIIVGLNRTRHLYNRRIRQLLGYESPMPVKDDKLVCLRNDKQVGIFNGSLWAVDGDWVERTKKGRPKRRKKNAPVDDGLMRLCIHSIEDEDYRQDKEVAIKKEFFLGTESEIPWQDKRGTQEFTYGYALTCHKSQGSQWNNVIVFDESAAFRDDKKRWLYTAVTRSAERLTVVM